MLENNDIISQKELYARLRSALNALQKERQQVQDLKQALHEPIAVIGMACDLPNDIKSLDSFWQVLVNLQNQVTSLDDERWSVEHYVNISLQTPGKMISDQGGFMAQHEQFDAHFFEISPREAVSMDPQQRLVLKNSWRALEHAGIAPEAIRGTNTGVFIGVTNTDYGHALLKQGKAEDIDGYSATGNALNVIAGRVSYFFDFHGPSLAIDTACSSSLVALHYACQSLRNKECIVALCSGVNVILLPEGNIALSQANMLSPDGRCYTFDERANGYVRGEGCISLVLKSYSEAQKDGDTVYALIKGSAVNHGGKSSGLTVPNAKAQAQLIRQALHCAHIEARDIDYIETHGTGTALGDPIEINALQEVFSGSHQAERPLLLGSVKTNFGHLESASGLLGLLKVILSMQHRMLPGTPFFTKLNPLIDLSPIPSAVVQQSQPWDVKGHAGVSSFGFSGINAHVVVAAAVDLVPKINSQTILDRSHHLLALSAKDNGALVEQKKQLQIFLTKNPQVNCAHLTHSYLVGRNHFPVRQAFVINSTAELLDKLNSPAEAKNSVNKRKKVAFLLSGQGSQYVGMGKNLYQSSPAFKRWIDKGCEVVNERLGCKLQDLLFFQQDELLNQTLYTQPALFIFNYALAQLWVSWGIEPDCLIGHSIGEYVAATLAGIMTYEEALNLVYERARLMDSLPPNGGMLMVMATKEEVEPFLTPYTVDVAIITQEYVVLSGLQKDLTILEKQLQFPLRPLVVSHAFHSVLMEPILKEFEQVASKINYKAPKKQVISNTSGILYTKNTVTSHYWAQHLRQAVDLRQSMVTLNELHYDVLLEIGPRPTFAKSPDQLNAIMWTYSLRRAVDDWHSLLMNLATLYELGLDINWKSFEADYSRQKIQMPGYPFQEKSYWALKQGQQQRTAESLYRVNYQEQQLVASPASVIDSVLLLSQNPQLIAALQKLIPTIQVQQQVHIEKMSKHILYAMDNSSDDVTAALKDHYQNALTLMHQLLASSEARTKPILWFLIPKNGLSQAALFGLRKCFLLETSDIDCRLLTVDVNQWDELTCQAIVAELQHLDNERQIHYQQGKRYVPRLDYWQMKVATKAIVKEASYLVTGGQGALGRLVVQWYVQQGVRHIVVLSRSQVIAEMAELIKKSQNLGCTIECLVCDVSDHQSLDTLLAEFGKKRPPLKGIIHAAGVLDDGLIQQQTWERFASLYAVKVLGAWYLHELSQQHELDHFVLFSSMASLLGTPGQANYAAANAFLDQLADYRKAQQLPALSINWGPWAEVGMAKHIIPQVKGLYKLKPKEGMALFDHLMRVDTPSQVMAARIDWKQAVQQGISIPFFEHLIPKHEITQHTAPTRVLDIKQLRDHTTESLKTLLLTELQGQFQKILRLDQPLAAHKNFFELGMDSLMAIELRNNLHVLLNQQVTLSQTLLFELTTLNELADYLVQVILDAGDEENTMNLLSKEEHLLQSLDELSEEEIDALLQESMKNGQ